MIDWYWIPAMMLFCHVIEDFHIQGILANLKQRKWWYEQTGYEKKYRNDYIPSILAHGFEWSVFIHLPLFYFYGFIIPIFISLIVNSLIHAYIDDMKCNKVRINLVQDQALHIVQIIITAIMITLIT